MDASFAGLSWSFHGSAKCLEDLVAAGIPLGRRKRDSSIRVHIRRDRRIYGTDDMTCTVRGTRARLRRADFAATIDLADPAAAVRYRGHPPALQSALRATAGLVLADRGGLLLHAAAVASGEQAFVFPGPSGAGKTTIASLAGHRPVLSDEIAAVVPDGDGFRADYTPFWGDLAPRRRISAGRHLAAIFFPLADDEVAIEPLTPGTALAKLLPCVFRCWSDATHERKLLDASARLVEEIPCHLLRFRRDTTFWETIDG